MHKKTLFTAGICLCVLCALGIAALIFRPFPFMKAGKSREGRQNRIIIPRGTNGGDQDDGGAAERMAYEDSIQVKAALGGGEIPAAVLTQDFDGDPAEEQFIAYRNPQESEGPIYVGYIDYDEANRVYRRVWDAPSAAARPGTVSLFTQDLIGDRSVCVILTGMDGAGGHTMTVFRKNGRFQTFDKIAELRIDGSLSIQETERPQAYHLGMAKGQSFTITASGHDPASSNILDQIEITYAYNAENGLYEQSKIVRIPGSQVEQRRLRELLSGDPGVFEAFINDLWYYVGPEGTLDNRQYIFFDPAKRELIFFGDDTQQVFTWQNASPTRYGLYISSQNISVSTLRRFLDIELQSLDSIRVKVFEDVRLKIGVSASWDGVYRRAGSAEQARNRAAGTTEAHMDALYDSSMGNLRFFRDGVYELGAGGDVKRGKYAFFMVGGRKLLELRPDESPAFRSGRPAGGPENGAAPDRELYLVEAPAAESGGDSRQNLSLSRVQLGTRGIQDLHEGTISLIAAGD